MNKYYGKNPNPEDLGTYTLMRVERAPDAGGAPGAFAEIAAVDIDQSDLFTRYDDATGVPTDWYKSRWSNAANSLQSGYTAYLQAGDSQMRQWIRADVPDADLTATYWDRWIDQALVDLYAFGLWKPVSQTITPTSTSNVVDREYAIDGALRDVYAVEVIGDDAAGTHQWWAQGLETSQRGRRITIPAAMSGNKYVLWGKGRFQTVGELTDEGYMLLYHMVRAKYLQYRENQRANYRKFVIMDRDSDISPEQIRQMKIDAQAEVALRIKALAYAEPAISLPEAGPPY